MATVQSHYGSSGIAGRLLAALRAASGPDVAITPETLAPLDQFHGRGLEATRDMVKLLAPQRGEHLADIGCGIGGPARWIASSFGCRITGVDLTPEFCTAARELTAACGLGAQVEILQGSATALPLPDLAFDRAYSQNVVMNIADKAAFYREALRVLKPGGLFAVTSVAAGPGGPPYFPVPWASAAEFSFLSTPEETRSEIAASGFELVTLRTVPPPANQTEVRRKVERDGLPALSIRTLMGDRFVTCQVNSMRSAEEARVISMEYVLRKPG